MGTAEVRVDGAIVLRHAAAETRGGVMKFSLKHTRAGAGTDLDVAVTGDGTQQITQLHTEYDGFVLADDDLSPPAGSFERAFSQVGDGGPGNQHKLAVTATDDKGKQERAASAWVDNV